MSYFGFEYFCGANVLVKMEEFTLLEAAGLAFDLAESKRPIYGYSSRHFDGVARGQVIIQGQIIVNYVHQDYMFKAVEAGLVKQGLREPLESVATAPTSALSQDIVNAGMNTLLEQGGDSIGMTEYLRGKYWQQGAGLDANSSQRQLHDSRNISDIEGALDIKVVFGEQNTTNRIHGTTGLLLRGVHFVGRGMQIRIDEDTIVESYPFFARNMYSLRNHLVVQPSNPDAESPWVSPEEDYTMSSGGWEGITSLPGNPGI